jgi:hypothetical protein
VERKEAKRVGGTREDEGRGVEKIVEEGARGKPVLELREENASVYFSSIFPVSPSP